MGARAEKKRRNRKRNKEGQELPGKEERKGETEKNEVRTRIGGEKKRKAQMKAKKKKKETLDDKECVDTNKLNGRVLHGIPELIKMEYICEWNDFAIQGSFFRMFFFHGLVKDNA